MEVYTKCLKKFENASGTFIVDYEKLKALEFIDNNCNNGTCKKPFFLFFSTHHPHRPTPPDPNHPEDRNFVSKFSYTGRGWAEGLSDPCDKSSLVELSDKSRYIQIRSNPEGFCKRVVSDNFNNVIRDQISSLRR